MDGSAVISEGPGTSPARRRVGLLLLLRTQNMLERTCRRGEVAAKGLAYKSGVVKLVLSSRRQQPTVLGFPFSDTL